MFNSIPTVIPKQRARGVIFALILSSAILAGSYAIIYSMTNVNTEFLGNSDDVFIFYDTGATTPFTSKVPKILINSFNSIDGVKIVSPEYMVPAVVNYESLYLRGANFSNLIELDNLNIISGKIPDENSTLEAIIGHDLAIRLGVSVNDRVQIFSIVTAEYLTVIISAIYELPNGKGDELIINFDLASSFVIASDNFVTHYRIKYNPNVITKQEIIDKALKEYNLSIKFNLNNGSIYDNPLYRYRINLIDKYGNLIYDKKSKLSQNISLVQGDYYVKIYRDEKLYNTTYIHVDSNSTIEYNIGLFAYNTRITVKYGNITMDYAKYNIRYYSHSEYTFQGTLNSEGIFNKPLLATSYQIDISDGSLTRSFYFSVNSISNITLDMNTTGSLIQMSKKIYTNDFTIYPTVYGPRYYLSIYNSYGDKIETFSSGDKIPVHLENGDYTIYLFRDNFVMDKFNFSVISTDSYIIPNFVNFAHFYPNQEISVKLVGLEFTYVTVNSELYNYSIDDDILNIILPEVPGLYNLSITGFINKQQISKNYFIIVEEVPEPIGWAMGDPIPIARSGDTLPIWINSNYSFDNSSGNIYFNGNNYYTTIPLNSSYKTLEKYNIGVQYTINNTVNTYYLPFIYVDSYTDLLAIENNTSIYSITTAIKSQNFTIAFNKSLSLNPYEWNLNIDMFNQTVRIYPDQLIPIPYNKQISTAIVIQNKFTGYSDTLNISLYNDKNSSLIPILIGGMPSTVIDGVIDMFDIRGFIANYSVTKDNKVYYPIVNGSKIILSPGNYSILFDSYIWNVTVPTWKYDISSLNVSATWGYAKNSSVIFSDVYYYSDSVFKIISKPLDLNMKIYRNLTGNYILVEFDNIVKANYTIKLSNGNTIIGNYTGFFELIEVPDLNATINVTYITMDGIHKINSFNLQLGKEISTYNLLLLNRSQDVIINKYVKIHTIETNETYSFFINGNTTISLSIIPQELEIYYYLDSNFSILLDKSILELEHGIFNYTVYTGIPKIKFYIYNPNFDKFENNIYIKITYINKYNITSLIQSNKFYFLEPGLYELTYTYSIYSGKEQIVIDNQDNITLNLSIYNVTAKLTFTNLPRVLNPLIYFVHKVLHYSQRYLLTSSSIELNNFPIGAVNIIINGTWGEIITPIYLYPDRYNYIIVIKNLNASDAGYDASFGKLTQLYKLGYVQAGNYFNEYMKGSFILINIILLSQIVIIAVILAFNIYEIALNLTFESRHEIKQMKSIGGTHFQVLWSYTGFLFKLIPVIAILGQFIAYLTIKLLLSLKQTVIFGHQINPNLVDIRIYLINLVFTFFVALFSLLYAYKSKIMDSFYE